VTRARLAQWARFQIAGPRDTAPVLMTAFIVGGLVLAAWCAALTVGAWL